MACRSAHSPRRTGRAAEQHTAQSPGHALFRVGGNLAGAAHAAVGGRAGAGAGRPRELCPACSPSLARRPRVLQRLAQRTPPQSQTRRQSGHLAVRRAGAARALSHSQPSSHTPSTASAHRGRGGTTHGRAGQAGQGRAGQAEATLAPPGQAQGGQRRLVDGAALFGCLLGVCGHLSACSSRSIAACQYAPPHRSPRRARMDARLRARTADGQAADPQADQTLRQTLRQTRPSGRPCGRWLRSGAMLPPRERTAGRLGRLGGSAGKCGESCTAGCPAHPRASPCIVVHAPMQPMQPMQPMHPSHAHRHPSQSHRRLPRPG